MIYLGRVVVSAATSHSRVAFGNAVKTSQENVKGTEFSYNYFGLISRLEQLRKIARATNIVPVDWIPLKLPRKFQPITGKNRFSENRHITNGKCMTVM